MESCAFEYLYRDASNYKAFGVLLLEGKASNSHRAKIIEVLDGGEFFIAEQVGVPTLYEELSLLSGRFHNRINWLQAD